MGQKRAGCEGADVSAAELRHAGRNSVAHMGCALANLDWPVGKSTGAPAVKAASGTRPRLQLGMAISRSAGPCISKHTRARPVLAKLLAGFIRHHLPKFAFCSIAVARSSEAGAHEDPNVGQTALIAVGRFTGGRLWRHDVRKDRMHTEVVKSTFVLFNAREPHGTCAFGGGPRFTIAAYTRVRAHNCNAHVSDNLRKLGFALLGPAAAQALPGKPPGAKAQRLQMARAAWRKHCGRGRGQKCVTQPGRRPGEHRATVWKCHWCGSLGVQHAGRPRKICKRKECALRSKREDRRTQV